MTAPPLKRTVVNCRSKNRYPDELAARAAGMVAIQRFGEQRTLYVYKCRECRGWHLTKRDHGSLARVTGDNPVHVKGYTP